MGKREITYHEGIQSIANYCSDKLPDYLPCMLLVPPPGGVYSYNEVTGKPSRQMTLDIYNEIEDNIQAREEVA